jgi:hypothetical protein
VEFKEELGGNGIVHSHHDMGAFHSGQDEKHCRNVYDYSIVVSNSKGYVASRRVKLPCGAFGYQVVKLTLTGIPEGLDLSKIREKGYNVQGISQGQERQTGLLPDEPDTEITDLNDMPCVGCTSFECEDCRYVDDRMGWPDRY